MRVIHIDNSNIRGDNIGGIVSYIRDISNKNSNIEFLYAGSGEPLFKNFIQVTKKIRSNLIFFLKLFFIQHKLPNDRDTIYHIHEAYMKLPFIFKRKSKFILTFHGHKHVSIKDRKSPILYKLYEILTASLINTFDGFISDSDDIYNFYKKRYRIFSGKSITIPVGVDLQQFKPLDKSSLIKKYNLNHKDQIILFIGRIAYEKNIELLIDSFELCNTKYNKNYTLFIGGEGPNLAKITEKAKGVTSSKNIKFLGKLTPDLVVHYMNISDVFTITSFREGGPIVLKEALACNLKVVSVPVGDAPEIIPKFKGCILTSYDPDEFSKSLIKAIEDGLSSNYSDDIAVFSKENFQKKINDFYISILN